MEFVTLFQVYSKLTASGLLIFKNWSGVFLALVRYKQGGKYP